MKNTWISLLIVLSIALQSFVAVANSNENHQVDAQHLQTIHSHDLDNTAFFDASSTDDHNIKDCHHCGHCQGSHTSWFVSIEHSNTTAKILVLNQYFYHANLDKSSIEVLIRPPIA
ncbi:MAG: hypothetical protein ACI87J_002141 [Colwellia sp.]|jgi:hypothetical protein